ncbi:MAG: TonB family protein [Bdellovibrionota bacterium]
MTEFGKSPQPSNFTSIGFRFSLLLHATLVLWLLAHWAAESFMNSHDDEANKKLRPKKSIRVDVVDLPNLKFNELHKVDLTKEVQKTVVTEKPKEEVVVTPPKSNPNAMKLPSNKKEKTASAKRLEEIQKNIRAEAKRQEILNKYKNQQKQQVEEDARPALGGNILSKGGSVQGDVANEADEFTATVQTHVRKFWKAPPWAAGQNYKVRVVVKIAPNGRVLSKMILRSSGRPEFDASAMEAVEAADPFPAPPEFFKRIIMNEGIECGFPD